MSWLHRREELRRVPEFSWPKGPEYQPRILSAEAQGELLYAIPENARGISLAMALMGIRRYNVEVDRHADVTVKNGCHSANQNEIDTMSCQNGKQPLGVEVAASRGS